MKKVIVDEGKCIRCGACINIAQGIFKFGDQGQSVPVVDEVSEDNKDVIAAMECCPTGAISLKDADGDPTKKCECGDECECDPCDCEDGCTCGGDCDCGNCSCE